jgi:predicted membrane protein
MNRNLKIATGLISLGLLATLIYKLSEVPGGMILSGLFLGGMWIVIILVVGLLMTWLTRLIFKKIPFWTIYFSLTAIAFAFFHYQIYSPTLKIVVPENYTGQVSLIKSNVTENILTVDLNGIGYLNKWTFNHTYSKPIVVDVNGKNLEEQLVGFNNSSFYGLGTSATVENQIEIKSKSFEIVPEDKKDEKQYSHTNLSELVDREKIK